MPRIYNVKTYRKHKQPKGWGSICPADVTQEQAQLLLDSGVLVDQCIYNVAGDHAYRAMCHEENRWHGHPIPWSRLPNAARKALIAAERLDDSTWRKAIRKGWGREYER